ncbi:MAG TPA: phage capsid protein [Sphingomonas sanguinis]|uniref:phage capsid protein n=1 Tax=Sphingomonas sanguinis TaxID=33051 RepID=UPI002AC28DF9|nr:phage capsid protein [Sphingomonas sanguinis]
MGDVNTTANYEFRNNVELQLQQTKSVLWDLCEEQDCAGAEMVSVKDLVGSAMPQEADERYGDLKQTSPSHDRVWMSKPNELYFNEFVDGDDELATRIGLTGTYTMAAMATMNRAWDSQILAGMYAPMVMGKAEKSLTTVAFPMANVIPVTTGGASGAQRMNLAKVRAAKVALGKAFNDPSDPRYMALSEVQRDDLLSEVQATDGDYSKAFGVKTDGEGNMTGLLGFTIVPIELRNPDLLAFQKGLTVTAQGYTRNLVWTRSGVRKGIWNKLRTHVKDQPQKVDVRSVFAGTRVTATRTQANKVFIIENSEA